MTSPLLLTGAARHPELTSDLEILFAARYAVPREQAHPGPDQTTRPICSMTCLA
jgi:hypothetical protein